MPRYHRFPASALHSPQPTVQTTSSTDWRSIAEHWHRVATERGLTARPASPARPLALTPEQRELRAAARAQGKAEARAIAAACLEANQPGRLPDMLARGLTLEQARAELGPSSDNGSSAVSTPGLKEALATAAANADGFWLPILQDARRSGRAIRC